jgi:DNA invertase Pin-like site-specific DNA recombinase
MGYRRVGSIDQRFDLQKLGSDVDRTFDDKHADEDRDRPELAAGLADAREGYTLRVYSADRFVRSLVDLIHLVDELMGRGVRVEFVERMMFDPSSTDRYVRCLMQVMGSFAELERNLLRSRQAEGVELAQRRGVYKGRQPALTPDEVRSARERREIGVPRARLTRDHGVAKSTMVAALAGERPYGTAAYSPRLPGNATTSGWGTSFGSRSASVSASDKTSALRSTARC